MIPLGVLASANVPASGGGGEVTFLGGAVDGGSATATRTISGVNFGEPAADRVLFAAIGTRVATGRQVTGVTIGGVSATIDINTSPSWPSALIARAVVPSGATGDVVLTYTASEAGPMILGMFSAYGTVALVDAKKHYSASTALASVSLAHSAGAALIGVVGNSHNSDVSFTWGSPFTPDYERNRTNNGNISPPAASVIHANGLAAGPTSVSVTSSAALYQGLAAAAYTIS